MVPAGFDTQEGMVPAGFDTQEGMVPAVTHWGVDTQEGMVSAVTLTQQDPSRIPAGPTGELTPRRAWSQQ